MFETVISSIITSSIVALIIQLFLKNGIKNFYDQKLATYNHKLAAHAESRRLDFERKIHDFSLYSTKRHELYPQMFKLIFKIYRNIKRYDELYAISRESISNASEIIPYYEELNIKLTNEVKDFIVEKSKLWTTNPDFCLDQISQKVKVLLYSQLAAEIRSADNYFMDNILFFSDETSDKVSNLLSVMLLLSLEKNKASPVEHSIDETKIKEDVDLLKEMLKKELNVGDYSN